MKLLDIFKKKKPAFTKVTAGKKPKEKKPEEKKVKTHPLHGLAYRVLESPHITEKATKLGEENKYVFKVFQKANKIEIKKAINDLYGVEVLDIKIINVPRKRKRLGRQFGWKKGYKKAIVKIKKGQKIEIISR